MSKKSIIRFSAIVLIVLFFMPLVSCGSLTGFEDGWSGFDIGTGNKDAELNPYIFILLIIPILLLVIAQKLMLSRVVSIAGIIAMFVFMYIVRTGYEGMLKMTIFSYTTLGIYILVAVISIMGRNQNVVRTISKENDSS